jgi:hypothetical protein
MVSKVNKLKLTATQIPEESIQRTAADLLDRCLLWPAVWTHFPAGGYSLGPAASAKLKRAGLKAGMPDIIIWFEGRTVGIELKRVGGYRSKAQREMHPRLEQAGVPVYLCRTPESVLDALLREHIPVQPSFVHQLLDRPYEAAERLIATQIEVYDGETNSRAAASKATGRTEERPSPG